MKVKVGVLVFIMAVLFSCRPSREGVTDEDRTLDRQQSFIFPEKVVGEIIDSILSNRGALPVRFSGINISDIKGIYRLNNNRAFWDTKKIAAQGASLIKRSLFHGLNSDDYFMKQIDSLQNCAWQFLSPLTLAYLDLVLTAGVNKYSMHLSQGAKQPEYYHPAWGHEKTVIKNSDSLLFQLLANKEIDRIESKFRPQSPEYQKMHDEFVRLWLLKSYYFDYKSLEYPGKIIRPGDTSLFVIDLKEALIDRGYLETDSLNPVFNTQLKKAIKLFQKHHGLSQDGIPGPKTCFFLRWTIEDYLAVLSVNMERLRWINDGLPPTRIDVNIPSADLSLFNKGQKLFYAHVIVGKYDNQTPVLASNINYLVFNPCWTVPQSIATKKFLKRMQRDSTFLNKRNMFIAKNGDVLDHDTIDFTLYNEKNFPFKIYQRSSDDNALGKVKFMFPNNYSIYLHDTPGKSLFNREIRAFSHGCVRVQHAERLAETIITVLEQNKKPIAHYYEKGYPVKVYLNNKIPLFINYFTCRYDPKLERLLYFKDIYYFDLKMLSEQNN